MQTTIVCPKCKKGVEIDPVYCVLMEFKFQPWFSYLNIMCPLCNKESEIFLGPEWAEWFELFTEREIGVVVEGFATEQLIANYCDLYEVKLLEEVDITKRMEEEIAALSKALAEMPDDLLWDVLNSPEPPHEKPERWC